MAKYIPFEEDYFEFLLCLREVLGLKPLTVEPQSNGPITLDGVRFMTRSQWAKELKITKCGVDYKLKKFKQTYM